VVEGVSADSSFTGASVKETISDVCEGSSCRSDQPSARILLAKSANSSDDLPLTVSGLVKSITGGGRPENY